MKIIGGERIRMADGTVAIVKAGGHGTLCICTIDGVVLANVHPKKDEIAAEPISVEEWSAAVEQFHVRRLIDGTKRELAQLDEQLSLEPLPEALERRRQALLLELVALLLRVTP